MDATSPSAKPAVFVAMPFAADHTASLRQIIEPAVQRAGGQAIRADAEKLGHIHTQMFARIIDSAALIIDLSALNANVFYEMGVAHALHKRSIMVVNRGHLDRMPFDVAPYRVLTYPDPASATPEELELVIAQLADEVKEILDHPERGLPNPVMDFLSTRSPVGAAQTLYLPALTDEHEREIILGVEKHLTFFGLTGSQLASKLAEFLESSQRSPRLELRLRLLDPDFATAWRFKKELQEGMSVSDEIVAEYIQEETIIQKRALQKFKKLSEKYPDFKVDVRFYRFIPVFWAYGWDDKKWAVGHYAMNRTQSRGLPVTVVAAADPLTRGLYAHYADNIENLAASPPRA